MKRKRLSAFLLILSLLAGIAALPAAAYAESSYAIDSFAQKLDALNEQAQENEMNTEEMIRARIILKSSAPVELFGDAAYIRGYRDLYVFQYPSHAQAQAALEHYGKQAGIEWVQFEKKFEASGSCTRAVGATEALQYMEQQSVKTAAVKVAVIDTGIDTKSALFQNAGGRLADAGYNTANTGRPNTAHDDNGHGTNVCEIIYANTPESVTISAYKALNAAGEGEDIGVAMCVDKAVEDGNDVINLSLGSEGETDPCLKEALQRAFDAGVTVIVAAGNEGVDVAGCTPACEEQALCVAAIDRNGNPCSFSNFGEGVDFTALGDDITTTYSLAKHEEMDALIGWESEYECCSGTSFSAPFVAASAAAVKAVHPTYRSAEIEQALRESAFSCEQLYCTDRVHPLQGERFEELVRGNNDYRTFTQYLYPAENPALYYGYGMPETGYAIGMERCEAVSFSRAPSHYTGGKINLSLSGEEGSEIRYTVDGTLPYRSESAQVFPGSEQNEAVAIEGICYHRDIAYKSGKAPSIVNSAEYFVEHTAQEDELSIGSDGLVTEYSGTYSTLNIPASVGGTEVKGIAAGFTTPNSTLTCLTLPASATKCQATFDSLVYFKAPGLETVNENAFKDSPLAVIDAPQVTSIGKNAFAGTNIRRAYFPLAEVKDFAFANCKFLESADMSSYAGIGRGRTKGGTIGQAAFSNCIRLKTMKTNPALQYKVNFSAFYSCISLRDFDFSNVGVIKSGAFDNVRCIERIIAPVLGQVESLPFSAKLLYAPNLSTLKAFPFAGEEPTIVIPKKCSISASSGDYIYNINTNYPGFFHRMEHLLICGDRDSYQDEAAEQQNRNFLHIPAITEQPADMGSAGGILTAGAIGIDLKYRWYGTNVRNNHAGDLLAGEESRTLDSSAYDYRYYFCEIIHTEKDAQNHDYVKTVRTGYTGEDVNADGFVDIADVSLVLPLLAQEVSAGNAAGDINGDKSINIADVASLLLESVYAKKQVLESRRCPGWELMK